MQRLLKYFIVFFIFFAFVYSFRLWLQYKSTTIIKQTTDAIIAELHSIDTLETVRKTFTKTLKGQDQLTTLVPNIGIDQIISSALFDKQMELTVDGMVSAGYIIKNINTGDITVSRNGTVTIILNEPEILGIELTGELQTTNLGIMTKNEIAMEEKLREKAKELMIQDALSAGILQDAKHNAKSVLQNLFLKANIQIKDIIVTSK